MVHLLNVIRKEKKMSVHKVERPEKNFDFRMSKKVAELTQVVHMLFTRNHEREVEIDALKKSYEHEIHLVIGDAKSRIGTLEKNITELKQKSQQYLEDAQREHENELEAKGVEWWQRLANQEKSLHEERTECQNLRDLLINAQRDIEKLRQGSHGVSDQLARQSDEMIKRDKDLECLRGEVAAGVARIKDAHGDAQSVISEMEKSIEKLDDEVIHLHNVIESNINNRDQLLRKNKQLECHMKSLKRDFNKRLSENTKNQHKWPTDVDTGGELERLQREVQRYRLELSNRDYNFNRMFTEKQPMVITQRASQSSGTSAPRQSPGVVYTFNPNGVSNSQHPSPLSAGANPHGDCVPISNNNHSVYSSAISQTPLLLKDRHTNVMPELNKPLGQLERPAIHDRFPQNVSVDKAKSDTGKSITISTGDRPLSSNLPSICSTPEQRKQLAKPKPLPRELLYGK